MLVGKRLHLRAVYKNIKTSACQLMHRGLEINDGLFHGNIKREKGNSGIHQMIARFVRKYRRDGGNATTSVFCHKSFAYATAATPGLTLAEESTS